MGYWHVTMSLLRAPDQTAGESTVAVPVRWSVRWTTASVSTDHSVGGIASLVVFSSDKRGISPVLYPSGFHFDQSSMAAENSPRSFFHF